MEKIINLLTKSIDSKIAKIINKDIIVSPEEFFSLWCPPKLTTPQLEVINSIFEDNFKKWSSKFKEYLLLWGEGSGKDFLCSRIITYVAYWLLHQDIPQKIFGFSFTEPISIINVSINGDHAREVFFKYLSGCIERTINPKTGKNWFQEQGMDLKDGGDIQRNLIRFPKNITAYSKNSEKYSAEGSNPILVVYDEIAEFDPRKAKELYDNIWYTIESRFGKTSGNTAKLFLISYLRHENDFMHIRWRETEEANNVFRSKKSTWEVRPERTKEDYKKAFEKSPEDAARRFMNELSVNLGNNFFKYPEKIIGFINNRNSPIFGNKNIVSNLLNEKLESWFSPNMVEELYILKNKSILTEEEKKRMRLLKFRHTNCIYSIHLDLAKGKTLEGGDCAGLAMGHLYPLDFSNEENNEISIQDKYGVYIDLMLQLRSTDNKELDFEDIRKFIYSLKDKGFYFTTVSLDGWQSVEFQQQLIKHDIETKTISVDKSLAPYQTLKELIYTNRLDYYNNNVFIRECLELLDEHGKVDHPAISYKRSKEEGLLYGSKDVSDAVAGMVYNLITNIPQKTIFVGISDSE